MHVSERTMRRYFNKRFGTSPSKYINLIRLNKVKTILKRAKMKMGIITNTANIWGFWHMGQFAKDYQQLFGELPSETLNKSKTKD